MYSNLDVTNLFIGKELTIDCLLWLDADPKVEDIEAFCNDITKDEWTQYFPEYNDDHNVENYAFFLYHQGGFAARVSLKHPPMDANPHYFFADNIDSLFEKIQATFNKTLS